MNVLPPWKLAERGEWAETHPWLAGFYFSLLMAPFCVAWVVILGGTELLYATAPVAALVTALAALVSWPVFAVGVKHRWGQRPDAKDHPPPSYRRRWSQASDAFLTWFMWMGLVSVIPIVFSLLTGTVRTVVGVIGLVAALEITGSTWMERRRRKRLD